MRRTAPIGLSLLLAAIPVFAQEQDVPTRAALLREAREQKAANIEPYTPNAFERAMTITEERFVPLLQRDGIHWKIGSLTTGSGLAWGGGYRHRRLFDREGAFSIWAARSLKDYWAAEASFDLPDLADGRVVAGLHVRRHHYDSEDFFGLGPSARRRDHSEFALDDTQLGGHAGLRPWSPLLMGLGYEYSRPRVVSADLDDDDGEFDEDDEVPIALRFDDAAAPGLGSATNFHRLRAFAELDYRQPKHARKGGWYRVDVSRYHDQRGAFTFTRADVDLRQYASVLAERRVFAFRVFASTSHAGEGSRVPFHLMPTLGGNDTLRGFRDYRFRGPHALSMQGEYRFEVWSGLDAALFYDAGKVAMRRRDLNLKDLEDAWGFGFRFHTSDGVLLRIDAGLGSSDGRHLYIVFGNVF
jgi:hypothetical protein